MTNPTPAPAIAPLTAPPPARRGRTSLVVGAAIVLVLVLRLVVYQVRDSEVAVVLTFGRASADSQDEAGPALKWPWPAQQVRHFDARLRVLKTPLEEMVTQDGRAILVGSFVLWRVSSAGTFLEKVGEVEAGERLLERLVRSEQSASVSQVPFGALVSTDPARLEHEALEARVKERVREGTKGLGIEVAMVGLRKLGLPEEATEAVFERMRKDREAKAAAIRAEGEAEAGRIRAEAQREKSSLLAAAEADARRALGDAEREAEQHYATLAEDPDLAVFLKKLEALDALLREQTTLVFGTHLPPFDLLSDVAPVSTEDRRGR